MELRYLPSPPNVKRMPYLTLVANTFEEERILCGLAEAMDRGGKIIININEWGASPARDLTCDFKGEPHAST